MCNSNPLRKEIDKKYNKTRQDETRNGMHPRAPIFFRLFRVFDDLAHKISVNTQHLYAFEHANITNTNTLALVWLGLHFHWMFFTSHILAVKMFTQKRDAIADYIVLCC